MDAKIVQVDNIVAILDLLLNVNYAPLENLGKTERVALYAHLASLGIQIVMGRFALIAP